MQGVFFDNFSQAPLKQSKNFPSANKLTSLLLFYTSEPFN